MYEQFYGLPERPFDLAENHGSSSLESHKGALANLEYGIGSRKGITLLVGEAGSAGHDDPRSRRQECPPACTAYTCTTRPVADRVRRDARRPVRVVG